jgi:hypothetical protein
MHSGVRLVQDGMGRGTLIGVRRSRTAGSTNDGTRDTLQGLALDLSHPPQRRACQHLPGPGLPR